MHVHRGSLVAAFAALLGAASLVLAGAATSAGVLPSLYVNYVGTNCTFTLTGRRRRERRDDRARDVPGLVLAG